MTIPLTAWQASFLRLGHAPLPGGAVYVGWYDDRNDPQDTNVEYFVGKSFDGGHTFPIQKAVNDVPFNPCNGFPRLQLFRRLHAARLWPRWTSPCRLGRHARRREHADLVANRPLLARCGLCHRGLDRSSCERPASASLIFSPSHAPPIAGADPGVELSVPLDPREIGSQALTTH